MAVIFIAACLGYCLRKTEKNELSASVKAVLLAAALSVGFYASAVITKPDTVSGILFGLYNISDDIIALGLLSFARRFTGISGRLKRERKILWIAAAADAVLMLINPFFGLMYKIDTVSDTFGSVFHYISQIKFLFYYHVGFMYICLILVFGILGQKISSTPKIYKMKYAAILVSICPVIGANAVMLYMEAKFDYSLILYTVVAFIMVYFTFVYVPNGLMERLLFFSVTNMRYGIICIDVDGKCVHANKTAKVYCDAEIDVENVENQIKKWYAEKLSSDPKDCRWESQRRIDGKIRNYSIEYKQIFDNSFRYIGCFFVMDDHTDEDERLKIEKYKATHDTLTGIYNKEYFYEEARRVIDSNPDTEYCIVCTDVKNFKLVNDVFGVSGGDSVLKEIAAVTARLAGDKFVYGRLTSDRFAICFEKEFFHEDTVLYEYSKVSNILGNSFFKIHVHIGIYDVDQRDARISVMCDRANLAIKTIKDSYQSIAAHYDNKLRSSAIQEQMVIGEFEKAMAMGQFLVYVQPQINSDGYISGGEALVRWQHPKEGIMSPGRFINILENTGLISKLDAYMWEMSCVQLRKWNDDGIDGVYLSVNISPKDFYLMDVYETITGLVKKYSINPKSLHLEITETAVMSNPRQQIKLIERLRKFGFLVEIDDFGSGYSSLNTLKDLNADVLKVDMGFLKKTDNNEKSRIILKMVISLAKSLDMEVITEGVETKEQAAFLINAGCDVFQGYYFAKPVSVEDFESNYLKKYTNV